jgi:hypothetical protein
MATLISCEGNSINLHIASLNSERGLHNLPDVRRSFLLTPA